MSGWPTSYYSALTKRGGSEIANIVSGGNSDPNAHMLMKDFFKILNDDWRAKGLIKPRKIRRKNAVN